MNSMHFSWLSCTGTGWGTRLLWLQTTGLHRARQLAVRMSDSSRTVLGTIMCWEQARFNQEFTVDHKLEFIIICVTLSSHFSIFSHLHRAV